MRGMLLAIACLCTLPGPAKAQSVQSIPHLADTLAPEARFEILQADSDAKSTFRLDRVTGNVDRLVGAKSGGWAWEKMRVLPHPKAVNIAKPHFRIVVLNLPAQVILLLDTESGATWQLVIGTNASLWQPIE